ncbi:MAG TPA: hypothetical protein VFM29_09110 [Vicinamibacteria bacterium]|nr:hypothetical protein [Vicinamibacteria bacterium]
MTFLTEAGKSAIQAAVDGIEARSSAEVVVLVRPRSGSYLHADLLAGIGVGLFTLWFQLFSPWEFSLPSILALPVLTGVALAMVVSRAPAVRRGLTSAVHRDENVRIAARAAFVDHGVDRTRGRTGILVYVSLLERRAEVVPDRGLDVAVAAAGWTESVAAIDRAARDLKAEDLAAALRRLGDRLAAALPRAEDDLDELAAEVVA